MSTQILQNKTTNSFSTAASHYDRWAHVQVYVARRLSEILPVKSDPRTILDVGCGTGLLSGMLAEHYSQAQIEGIDLAPGMVAFCRERWGDDSRMTFTQADAAEFQSRKRYDLITSSCSLQWFPDPLATLQNLYDLTEDSATLTLAVILKGSLPELYQSYEGVCGRPLQYLKWYESSEYLTMVEQAGFEIISQSDETHFFGYNDPWEVMRSLQGIGATFQSRADYQPLSIRQMKKLSANYQSEFSSKNGEVIASYKLLYLSAKVVK